MKPTDGFVRLGTLDQMEGRATFGAEETFDCDLPGGAVELFKPFRISRDLLKELYDRDHRLCLQQGARDPE